MRALLSSDARFQTVDDLSLHDACSGIPNADIAIANVPETTETTLTVLNRLSQAAVGVVFLSPPPQSFRKIAGAGPRSAVSKTSPSRELVRAILAIANGHTYSDTDRGTTNSPPSADRPEATLSARETTVLRLLAKGHSQVSIAAALGIGVKSVQTYRSRAFDKLLLRSRVDFIRYAIKQGWFA